MRACSVHHELKNQKLHLVGYKDIKDVVGRPFIMTTTSRVGNHAPNTLYKTNDYSIISKYSAAKCGYYEDPWLIEFVEDWLKITRGWRRTPLVNLGYLLRVIATNYATNKLLKDVDKPVDCFIVLGCGYDMRVAYHEKSCNWIEIDLPQVIETKARYFAHKWQQPEEYIGPGKELITFSGRNVHLISCDITDQQDLSSKLTQVFNRLSHLSKVAILNEVCLCYLETSHVENILREIKKCTFQKGASSLHYIGFEQRLRDLRDPFCKIMRDHFSSISYPLKYLPDDDDHYDIFIRKLGFDHIKSLPLHELYHSQAGKLADRSDETAGPCMEIIPEANTSHVEKDTEIGDADGASHTLCPASGPQISVSEPFDEFEELDMYTSHYEIFEARVTFEGRSVDRVDICCDLEVKDVLQESVSKNDCSAMIIEPNREIQRYGHSACVLRDTSEEQVAFLSGGFGLLNLDDKQHKRLGDGLLVTRNSTGSHVEHLSLEDFPAKEIRLDRMHGQTCCFDTNKQLILLSGGRQNPLMSQSGHCNATAIVRITDDKKLELVHKFEPDVEQLTWRHRVVKCSDDQVIQFGGLTLPQASSCDPKLDLVLWNLSSDKLGFSRRSMKGVTPRHSFGMDMRDRDTLLIYQGLGIRQQYSPNEWCVDQFGNKYRMNISNFAPLNQILLCDLRQNQCVMDLKEAGGAYGAQVCFANNHQFIRIGGISTSFGTPEQSINWYDLRMMGELMDANRETVTTPDDDLILCNVQSLQFKESNKIITYGGGGNMFTFGTHFNRSQVVYDYSQSFNNRYKRLGV